MQQYSTHYMPNEIKRGDIFYINNNRGQSGSEIKKDRPAVVVSADFLNAHSDVVVIVFLTSQPKKDMATHVTIRSTGRVSEALCEQPTSVSIAKLNNYIGQVTDNEMQQIDLALMTAMHLDFASGGQEEEELIEETVPEETEEPMDAENASGGVLEQMIRLEAERDIYKKLYEDMMQQYMKK